MAALSPESRMLQNASRPENPLEAVIRSRTYGGPVMDWTGIYTNSMG